MILAAHRPCALGMRRTVALNVGEQHACKVAREHPGALHWMILGSLTFPAISGPACTGLLECTDRIH